MYKTKQPLSTYAEHDLYLQAKEYLNKRGVSFVKWLDIRMKLLLDGKDETVVKYAVGGVIALGIIGTSIWGYKEITKVRCSNFKTQAEAQVYFEKHDARWLDRDIVNGKAVGDGIACESLPKR